MSMRQLDRKKVRLKQPFETRDTTKKEVYQLVVALLFSLFNTGGNYLLWPITANVLDSARGIE
jgi:hypothetical protein